MERADYDDLSRDIRTNLAKSPMQRCAEGLALLIKLGGGSLHAAPDVIFAEGPDIEDLSAKDARILCELGWRDFGPVAGFQFFT